MLLVSLTFLLVELRTSSSHSPLNIFETDDFETLVLKDDLFIDKSLLIDEYLDYMDDNSTVPVLLRPEGWGKSTNADMLRKFFEIEVDDKGERLPKEKQKNHLLFLGGDYDLGSNNVKKLEPLKIANSQRALQYLGKHPVILVKLKNATGDTFEEIEKNLKLCISQEFQRHKYLLLSSKITDRVTLSRYLSGDFNATELISGIDFLSIKLHEHFGQKVQILIDDSDVPVINGHISFFNHPDHRKFDSFRRTIIMIYNATSKNNPCRNICLVSGVFPPAITTNFILPPVKAFEAAGKRPPFAQHYGFNQDELQQVLNKVPFKVDLHKLQSWYGGYRVFGPENYYNPRSVKRCLANNGTLKYYGSESNITTLADTIILLDDVQQHIQKLLLGIGTTTNDYSFNFVETTPLTWGDILSYFRVLFLGGYLTADTETIFPIIAIPNQEIRYVFETKVMQWMARKFCITPDQFRSFVARIPQEKIFRFQDSLRVYLDAAASFYPLNERSAQLFYPTFMIAIINALSTSHWIPVPEQGTSIDKINDTLLMPIRGQSDAAIFITYKIITEERNLKSTAKAGLWDMNFRIYDKRWKPLSHIKKMIEICMAFCKEKVNIQFSVENFKLS